MEKASPDIDARILLMAMALTAACLAWSSLPPTIVLGASDSSLEQLVAEGERLWTRSPDAGNPVACATCHRDPAKTRGWAASFPKFKPLPPPHSRVMTLLQANAEAVERHYRLAVPLPAATAITAFLTAQGAGIPISPGISAGQPVFPARMRELAASVVRGERLYARSCGQCHKPSVFAASVMAFPRVVEGRAESLEGFIERHQSLGQQLSWDGQATSDIMAYLMSQAAGRPIGHHTYQASTGGKEGS